MIQPYYQDGWTQIYCGNNAAILPALLDESIDLTVTSPPYGNLRKYNGYTYDFEAVARELYRVTKQGGVVVWVEADETIDGSESGDSFRHALYFKDCGFNLHDTMIYRKINGAMGSCYTYLQEYEFMFVLSRGIPKTANLLRDRANTRHGFETTPKAKSNKHGSITERKLVERQEHGRRKNIWSYPVGGHQEIGTHPGIFPEALANDHIRSWSNPGDTILDPFMGSNTTGKMARLNGCKFIGIEISKEYCELSVNRLRQEVFKWA